MTAPPDRDLIVRARRTEADQADAFGELVTRYRTISPSMFFK